MPSLPGRASGVLQISRRYVPGLGLLWSYRGDWLRHDLIAGLSVAAVALPTGLAYAELAGFSAVVGLYSAIFPLFAYALFGSSRQLITGPDAATCALVAGSLGPLAGGDPDKYLAYSVILTLLTGIFCIAGGLARLGFIANFLSRPILTGFLNGVAINIIVGQLGKIFGFSVPTHDIFSAIVDLLGKLGQTHLPTLLLGGTLMVCLLALKRLAPRLPGPLVAVVAGVLAVGLFGLDDIGVKVIGAIPAGLPEFRVPTLDPHDLPTLLRDSFGIVLVSFTSAMLTARSFAAKNGYDIDVNQEFIAIGTCNLASGIAQGFAVSGADSRTAVSDSVGGKSQLTGVFAGLVMLLVLLFLTGPLSILPVAALGAVLIVSAMGLIDLRALRSFYGVSRGEFGLAVITTLGVVTVGSLPGILVAVGLAILRLLAMTSRPHDAVLGRVAGLKGFHNMDDYPAAQGLPGLLLYRFDMSVVFFNADYFKSRVMEAIAQSSTPVKWFVLDARPINHADITAVYKIDEVRAELQARGIVFAIAGPKRMLLNKLDLGGVLERLGRERVFFTVKSAVRAFERAGHGQPAAVTTPSAPV
jgi:high affinity sulfate transporter 1